MAWPISLLAGAVTGVLSGFGIGGGTLDVYKRQVFGTGTVLLPWAVLALLGGDVRMSVGLLVLYSVISLVRSLLEPRLVGARVGLPPLAALVCMYVGFQALGVLGMLLAPLAAVLARQLWDSGLLHSLFGP